MREHNDTQTLSWLAACLLWIGVWQAASLMVGNRLLLAGPLDTAAALVRILTQPATVGIVWFSLSRIAAGFLASFLAGIALALVAHRLDVLRVALSPVVSACKSVPVACVTVLLLIWVGSREVSAIAVFLMAFPALYLAMLEGLAQSRDKTHEMLVCFGVGRPRRLCAHTWPQVLPYLVAASKNACGMAWKAGVAAELIGTPLGSVGERVYQAKILLETADLFAWTILIVLVSFACERAFVGALRQTGPAAQALSLVGTGKPHACDPQPLEVSEVVFGYDPAKPPVLDHVSASCPAGSHLVLDAASGTGKTTLIGIMAGLLTPQSGQVHAPERLSVVFQESRLIERMSAVQNVVLVSKGSVSNEAATTLLTELLPASAIGRPVSELSGGQRRRVELVRALAHPSGAVLLDEPFSSLDKVSHADAVRFVRAHLAGRPLVVASHDPQDRALLS